MKIGACLRALTTRSSRPLPRIGSVLAVHVTMMSNCASRSGISFNVIASAAKRAASSRPRSSVRLAIVIARGLRAAKCVAVRSIISPAPMSRIRCSAIDGKMRSASFTEAAAIEIDALPISVWARTSFATANVRWNNRFSTSPSVPAASAWRTACFIWPRICGSPSTIESRPEATRNAWVTACSRGNV